MGSEQYCNALVEKFASGELEIQYEEEDELDLSTPVQKAIAQGKSMKAITYDQQSKTNSKTVTDRSKRLTNN